MNIFGLYTKSEIDDFIQAILKQEKENIIHSKLDSIVDRFNKMGDDEQKDFYQKAKNYLKLYSFLSQILPYEDIWLEKLYIFLKKLISKLKIADDEDLVKGILSSVDFDSYRVQLHKKESIALESRGELLPSSSDGTNKNAEANMDKLSLIVKEFNERFGDIDWGDDDKLQRTLKHIQDDMMKDEKFIKTAKQSDRQNTKIVFDEVLKNKIEDIINTNLTLYQKFIDDIDFSQVLRQRMFEVVIRAMQDTDKY